MTNLMLLFFSAMNRRSKLKFKASLNYYMFIYILIINNTIGLVGFWYPRQVFIGLICYGIIVYIVGRYQYYHPQVKELVINSPKVSEEINIVFITDFQYDKSTEKWNSRAGQICVDLVNAQQYDLLLMGGDYANYEQNIDPIIKQLATINDPKLGTYSILGNHDYINIERVCDTLRNENIIPLFNEQLSVNDKFQLIAVEDEWFGQPQLPTINPEKFNLVLAHNPESVNRFDLDGVDLVLSGHTHNGQTNFLIFPFPHLVGKYVYGLYKIGKTKLYVSSGLGGSLLRGKHRGAWIRFLAQPEIVKVVIKPAK